MGSDVWERPPITGCPWKIRSGRRSVIPRCKRQTETDQSPSAFRPSVPTTTLSLSLSLLIQAQARLFKRLAINTHQTGDPTRCTPSEAHSRNCIQFRSTRPKQRTGGEDEEGYEHHGHGVVAEPQRAALRPGGVPPGGGLLARVVGPRPDHRVVPRPLVPPAPAPRGAPRRRACRAARRPPRHRPPLLRTRPSSPAVSAGTVIRRRCRRAPDAHSRR